jgi:hypothetical protein
MLALLIFPFSAAAQNGNGQNGINPTKNGANKVSISENNEFPRSVMAITPREIDIGVIGSGETASGVFNLKNMGSGTMSWATGGVEGWKSLENRKLSSLVQDDADYLRIEIGVLPKEQSGNSLKAKYPVEIKLTAGNGKITCRKDLSSGPHREAIKIISPGGLRTIFFNFKIVSAQELAQINLNPARLDMGSVLTGKTVSKKIRLTNKGKENLKWSVAVSKHKRSDLSTDTLKKGRYISFVNEEIRGSGVYSTSAYLREFVDVMGKWTENDGYPSSNGGGNSLKFQFNGTGLVLYYLTYPNIGNLTIYLDERLINEYDWFADQKEHGELLIAEGLTDGRHTVNLVNKDGHLDIEGIKILGKDIARGPAGWISIFPDSGSTTLETEYINVSLNTAQLTPGLYGDNIVFNSNGGEGNVEVFVEVMPDRVTKVIDVYRYSKGLDFLFTANPQAETKRLSQNSYVKEGIAFRLFVPETPGTTSFYRWYNPQKQDHFYHYDYAGGGKQLQGYVFEGSIGNIATSRMTNTKELYRWYNPATSHYFYTTDPRGESVAKKKYRFDGIAGYVK